MDTLAGEAACRGREQSLKALENSLLGTQAGLRGRLENSLHLLLT
jgi:hypothetical protein